MPSFAVGHGWSYTINDREIDRSDEQTHDAAVCAVLRWALRRKLTASVGVGCLEVDPLQLVADVGELCDGLGLSLDAALQRSAGSVESAG